MRIVLFGAGASYGSGDVLPHLPPLGNELFSVLRRLYNNWQRIPPEVADLFQNNFELGMGDVISKYGFAVAPLMQSMAIFFSIFYVPENADNRYLRLIQVLENRRDIVWSTLNYECILESSAFILNRKVNYFADPLNCGNDLPVWKLHGSCSFKVEGLDATRGIQFSGVTFGGSIKPITPSEVRSIYTGNTALYPAMALYARGKAITMSPEPIFKAQKTWGNYVRESDRVLIVGVNPNPEDNHIWDPLSNTEAEVAYVGADSLFKNWTKKNRKNRPSTFLGNTWERADGNVRDFLLY